VVARGRGCGAGDAGEDEDGLDRLLDGLLGVEADYSGAAVA
jgi:hypothetical protein